MRTLGFESKSYGLKGSEPLKLTNSESNSYNITKNHLTKNYTENDNKIQQDVHKIVDRRFSLPERIKAIIMTLV